MYGRAASLVFKRRVRAVFQQHFHYFARIFHAGINKGSVSGFVPLVYIYPALFQKGLHNAPLIVFTSL